ncbi:Rne/Rng family ribonuclease [Pseudoxanthobacter sp. M-2]|uniref:ribonuclease E/G n=1 Tax=Pseudoxanthobacter sp. M-2 TaxID=3078754 RepID=UPI0038FC9416
MANKMLVDATHPEETRVVVVRGSRVEEFDFESATRKPLRGNIYLAKVTRVEPSLQAAFIEYGGNRHGFLAFSEIHPDYYQIPFADRQALLEQEAEDERSAADDHHDMPEAAESGPMAEDTHAERTSEADTSDDGGTVESVETSESVESVGAEDALEEVPERRPQRMRRSYKIQEVIKRRQVMLVQVVKEERGNKGAALTTYLSLAGRYAVLMPNTARGGGISRKITSAADRKRLKQIATDLEVPEGMGVILRTAGANRTKVEVKRDFEYLLRLWESVRELTLQSVAPTLVYEEGSLIKRSIRDLYNKDIDEVIVAGDDGYREAKDFMRMLMPSHAKNVQPYREASPIFTRFGVEAQLDAMFSPQVTLKSGGYLVLHQTEALVSVDVNSGRSTREHNIEDTALQTNLEAADEVARQLRLRDLAGLIVIDFIDMEEKRNNRAVEKRLKEALRTDRARIQVGRISHFGLMEMSRQRIRTGVVESSTQVCPHCFGTGVVRSTESVALHVLRVIEDVLLKSAANNLHVRCRTSVALYILNQKRRHLADIEGRFGVTITIAADESLGTQLHAIEKGEPATRPVQAPTRPADSFVKVDSIEPEDEDVDVEEDEEQVEEAVAETTRPERPQHQPSQPRQAAATAEGEAPRRRRRRRRRRGGDQNGNGNGNGNGDRSDHAEHDEQHEADGGNDAPEMTEGTSAPDTAPSPWAQPAAEAAADAEAPQADAQASKTGAAEASSSGEEPPTDATEGDSGEDKRRRRRGRRGGRRRAEDESAAEEAVSTDGAAVETTDAEATASETTVHETAAAEPQPEQAETPAAEPTSQVEPVAAAAETPETESVEAQPEPAAPVEAAAPQPAESAPAVATPEPVAAQPAPEPDDGRPKRSGWWQRRSFF